MKYLKQIGIIIFISFLGELLNSIIPLPVPASVYGIVILFLCLNFKIVKVRDIKETCKFLIDIMPLMFVPAAVGLIVLWDVLKESWLIYALITVVSTVVVMAVSGRATQFIVRKKNKAEEGQK
ncbi:MAG: CidA/LrgA family protein [Firmicutes bacterium]|nr:CidA/LrgA family protein [Bacillota bacterium]